MTSLQWKKDNFTGNDSKEKRFKELMKGKYGFSADKALIHDITKYLKQCLYGGKWDISLETNHDKLKNILNETRYLSNVFRNHGGIEDETEINTLKKDFQNK